jgi:hypothetical protein
VQVPLLRPNRSGRMNEQRQTQIAVDPWDVKQSLGALGLSQERLLDAVRAGELERISCTAFDPPSYPGTAAWGHAIRHFRGSHFSDGWRTWNKNNLPLTVHAERQIGIMITSGSSGTGDRKRKPTTKYPKGPMTVTQIRANQQATIFDLLDSAEASRFVPMPEDENAFITWCLLIYAEFRPRDESHGTHIAMCELSLPAEVDENGYVSEWTKRIIFPPVHLDDVPTRRDFEDEDEGEIDVPVARK